MNGLSGLRKVFKFAAVAATLTSVTFSIAFGASQSNHWILAVACALFFGVCSVCSDYAILFVRQAFRERDYSTGAILSLGAAFLFTMNMVGHVGSVGYTRKSEMKEAYLKQTSEVDARKEVASVETAIKLASMRLEDLNGKLKLSEEWSVAVSPAGLAAQIKNLEGDKVYVRSGECSRVTLPASRAFCDKLNGLRTRLADIQVAEGLRKEIADANERLSRLTEKKHMASEQARPSANREQAGMFAQLATVSLEPGENATEWTVRGLAVYVALGLCICPIFLGMIGWGGDQSEALPPPPPPAPAVATTPPPLPAKVALVEVTPEPEPVVERTAQVPLPPRKLQFVGDTSAFARRVAGIIQKRELAA